MVDNDRDGKETDDGYDSTEEMANGELAWHWAEDERLAELVEEEEMPVDMDFELQHPELCTDGRDMQRTEDARTEEERSHYRDENERQLERSYAPLAGPPRNRPTFAVSAEPDTFRARHLAGPPRSCRTAAGGDAPAPFWFRPTENEDAGDRWLDDELEEERNIPEFRNCIWLAAHEGRADHLKHLVFMFPDMLDKLDGPWASTPLLEAVCMGHGDAAAVLLEFGADTSVGEGRDPEDMWAIGNTPLLAAAACLEDSDPLMAEILVRHG
ncbi:hypothetical protein T484DRAFT_1859630 [Baffinella frigidus]|nr:hypothetical protein T484DRAFT_1859630 [Cryptophyta sp. CCMP2293]